MAKRRTPIDIIDQMINDIFKSKDDWTKDALARNKGKRVVTPFAADATCFCLIGGLAKAIGKRSFENKAPTGIYMRARRAIAIELNGGSVTSWNDSYDRTFREVKSMLRRVRGKLRRGEIVV